MPMPQFFAFSPSLAPGLERLNFTVQSSEVVICDGGRSTVDLGGEVGGRGRGEAKACRAEDYFLRFSSLARK